jgi:DNA-binding transcriptional MocR family regulator
VYDAHVAALRTAYASRRDALAGALQQHLPSDCAFALPAGGFFLWVTLPEGLSGTALLPVAERHRVGIAPGARFSAGGDGGLRLAFSLYDEPTLAEGARRLAAAIREAVGGA